MNNNVEQKQLTNREKMLLVNQKKKEEEERRLAEIEANTIDSDTSSVTNHLDSSNDNNQNNKEVNVIRLREETQQKQSNFDVFGVQTIYKPKQDAQISIRIPSDTKKKFYKIVETIYGKSKPNYNQTMTQIIESFIATYESENGEVKIK